MRFRVGDEVRLKNGWTRMLVTRVSNHPNDRQWIQTIYSKYPDMDDQRMKLGSEDWTRSRESTDFVRWDGKTTQKQEEEDMDTLYQIKDESDVYAKKIGVNSEGNIVLEVMSDGAFLKKGDIKAFSKTEIEEVMPHTVEVTVMWSRNGNEGRSRHFVVPKGSLNAGDLLIDNYFSMFRVTRVDTRCKKAESAPTGLARIATTPVAVEQAPTE